MVHYPFHPLHGEELEVYLRVRRGESVTTVFVGGKKLQIPTWMLEPWAAATEIELQPMVAVPALMLVVALLGQLDGKERTR